MHQPLKNIKIIGCDIFTDRPRETYNTLPAILVWIVVRIVVQQPTGGDGHRLRLGRRRHRGHLRPPRESQV